MEITKNNVIDAIRSHMAMYDEKVSSLEKAQKMAINSSDLIGINRALVSIYSAKEIAQETAIAIGAEILDVSTDTMLELLANVDTPHA